MKRSFFLLAVFASAPAVLMGAQDWPEFRGPTAQGLSTATNVPVKWSATDSVAWKTAVPGKGWSSPVLVNGKIYLTSAVQEKPDAISLRALCFSSGDGKLLWNTGVLNPDVESTKKMHSKNSLASPTPIVHGDDLFVHFGHLGTACLSLDGKVRWRQTEIKYAPVHGNGGTPLIAGPLLVFGCDSAEDPTLVALDKATGKLKWRTPRNSAARNKFSFATPLLAEVDGRTQIISPASGFVGGYDPADGREIWRFRYGNGYSVVPRPVISHGLVFISSGFDKPVLHAIRLADAKGDITETHAAWSYSKGVPNTPSMSVVGDEIYFVSDGGIATCLDSRTGSLHWSERLGGGFSASPIHAGGYLFFLNEEGVGFVIRPGKTFDLVSKNEMGERALASYAVTDNRIFVRTEAHLWAIGK